MDDSFLREHTVNSLVKHANPSAWKIRVYTIHMPSISKAWTQLMQGTCWCRACWMTLFTAKMIKPATHSFSTRLQLEKLLNKQAFTNVPKATVQRCKLKGKGNGKTSQLICPENYCSYGSRVFFWSASFVFWLLHLIPGKIALISRRKLKCHMIMQY